MSAAIERPSKRPWIDIASTAVPRLLTAECIGSLLTQMVDRSEFRLRWLFHLDQHPLGLEDHWHENMRHALDTAQLFDDAVVIGSRSNVGYGEAVYRLMREVRHPVLWAEDDKRWVHPFSLASLMLVPAEIVALNIGKHFPGSTSPALWKPRAVQWLLDHYPADRSRMSEQDMYVAMSGSGCEIASVMLGGGRRHWVDVGKAALRRFGVPHISLASGHYDPERRCFVRAKPFVKRIKDAV